MQRLVAVRLGDGDVVLEPAQYRLVEVVHHAQGPVAGVCAVDDDAEAEHVHEIRERLALGLHLSVDRVQVLLPADHLGVDPFPVQARFDRPLQLFEQGLAAPGGRSDGAADAVGAQRIERLEREFLELEAHRVHPQAIGDGSVEVERLAGDALALVRWHDADRAHVVQPVGQLHQDDAQVPGRGHGHFLEVLGLGFRAGVEDRRQFGDAVDDFRHLLAERLGEPGLGYAGVLEHVVHDRRHDRLVVHAHVRKDGGNRKGMGDVLMPGASELALVGGLGEVIGAFDGIDPAMFVDAHVHLLWRGARLVWLRLAGQSQKSSARSSPRPP